jgi:hypothetical protein
MERTVKHQKLSLGSKNPAREKKKKNIGSIQAETVSFNTALLSWHL